MTDICQVEERLGQVGSHQLEEAGQLMGKVSGLLRADVSILIPSYVARAEPSVSLQAKNIVSEADCPRLVVEETDHLPGPQSLPPTLVRAVAPLRGEPLRAAALDVTPPLSLRPPLVPTVTGPAQPPGAVLASEETLD